MKKNVTIYDIAKESGVSVSTVSRVLNKSPLVSDRSMERVRAVIDKYQFEPSAVARAMSQNYTKTLGVLVTDIANPYFSALFLEIQRYAMQNNYSIILCNTSLCGAPYSLPNPYTEKDYFQMLLGKRIDGAIVLGGENDKDVISEEYKTALRDFSGQIPTVVIGREIEGCSCIFLNRNQGKGISTLVRHLAALGNQRIGFVGGEPGIQQTTTRLQAYKSTLESIGLGWDPDLIALTNFYTGDGYEGMMGILKRGVKKPDAMVAINDAVAVGAIRAILDCGLRCPEDIAIVSGDQFFDSEYAVPRLTTLDQQNDYLGRLSILSLIGAINGVSEPITFEHSPRLIIRESCGAKIRRTFG